MQHYRERWYDQHHKSQMPNVKLSSFDENSDPNVYIGWEVKVKIVILMLNVLFGS